MKLFQLAIMRDQDWQTINELFNLDFLHYIDITEYYQPKDRVYGEKMRRSDDMARRIDYCEEICKNNSVELRAPESLDDFNHSMKLLSEKELTIQANLFEVVEKRMKSDESFFR